MTEEQHPYNLREGVIFTAYEVPFTIDQASQLTWVSKAILRYWEKPFGQFLHPARTPSNRREYTVEDIGCIKTIKRLLEQEHLTPHGVRLRLAVEG